MRCRIAFAGAAVLAAALATAQAPPSAVEGPAPRANASSRTPLSDADFHALVTGLSEPGGTFVTDNLLSNEIAFQDVLPELQRRRVQGAYIGVGPEQNLSYIAALQPPIAFVVDLQRGNLRLHLLYKALIELSNGRADFLSRMFCRARPHDLTIQTPASQLFDAYRTARLFGAGVRQLYLQEVFDRLTRVHRFGLTRADRNGITAIYRAWCDGGPDMRGDFGRNPSIPSWVPSYAEMMTAADPSGENQSLLGSEARYLTLRQYQLDNLIVPIVGDFAGDKALRAVGAYLARRGLTVGTFYTSNVEDYLFRSDAWRRFFRNVSTLPLDDQSMFIRTYFTQSLEGMREYADPIRPMLDAFSRGEIKSYDDVIGRSRVPRP